MIIMLWLGVITLVLYAVLGLDLVIGSRSIRFLREVQPHLPIVPPRVTIVAAARNESRHIREALSSLLSLDYPDYELVVVNDRSEDATGSILDEMALANPRLRVIHVTALPPGWLGKNHALWVGSRRATGELILFTDADIIMEPSVLSRAVTFLLEKRLDHLVVSPRVQMPTLFLQMFGEAFALLFFSLFVRPWKARDPNSSCHIGIGAFNLVSTAAYRQVGGHETIRLRPDDDLKLGKIIKQAGLRQDVAYGGDFLLVEWYATVPELVRGLEKNAFAGADYNIAMVLAGVLFHSLCSVFPYAALFVTHGATRAVYAIVVCLITLLFADSARFQNARPWHAVGYPLAAALFVYILLRTMVLNLIQGGIYWRGTFYPLAELKENKV